MKTILTIFVGSFLLTVCFAKTPKLECSGEYQCTGDWGKVAPKTYFIKKISFDENVKIEGKAREVRISSFKDRFEISLSDSNKSSLLGKSEIEGFINVKTFKISIHVPYENETERLVVTCKKN